MKKKIGLFIATLFVSSALVVSAHDYVTKDVSELPQKAQTTINSKFNGAEIKNIKVDKDNGVVEDYEVLFVNGVKIEFDSAGEWKEVSSRKGDIPQSFIPQNAIDYVKKNHPGQKIVSIEKDRSGIEINLSNDVELKFNKSGKLVEIDD